MVQKLKGSAEATPVDTDGFAGGNQSEVGSNWDIKGTQPTMRRF